MLDFKKHLPLLFFLLIAVITFGNTWSIGLWDQDESAYAGFAKTMIESGDWLIPDYMWSDIHRKPPLHFWNIALAFKAFGYNHFAVRFSSALFILLTYVVIYFAGKPLFGKRESLLGAVVLSTSFLVPALAKVAVTDATLLFFSTVCAFALLHIMQKRSLWWTLAFWGAFSMALLTKGPPIIIFTGLLGLGLLILHPNRKHIISLHPWIFLPLACIPLFLWGYFAWQRDGGTFISWMIDWYILKRIGGSVLGQTAPPGAHLAAIFVFFLPWVMFSPRAFWDGIKAVFKRQTQTQDFLLGIWFIAGWLIYEFSPSKLPAYVIAAHVPLALLIGRRVLRMLDEQKQPNHYQERAYEGLMFLLIAAFMAIPFVAELSMTTSLIFWVTSVLLFALLIFVGFNMRSARFVFFMVAFNLALQATLHIALLPAADELRNAPHRAARFVQANANPTTQVLIGNASLHPPSLPYYLRETFANVIEEKQPQALLEAYQSQQPTAVILNRDQYEAFKEVDDTLNAEVIYSEFTGGEKKAYYVLINIPGSK